MNLLQVRIMLTGMLLVLTIGLAAVQKMPFLSPLFTNNMVLQRNMKVAVWGWTSPGRAVYVQVAGKRIQATAGTQGKWLVKIGPFPAGGPYTVRITGPQTVTLQNVLFGDVWICSGQSNMEMGIALADNAEQEIAAANYPQIRLYLVPKVSATSPLGVTQGQWQVCSPVAVAEGGWGGFSAAAYYFGRKLQQDTHVPIGLIDASWGGTAAEAWTSGGALKTLADFYPAIEQLEMYNADPTGAQAVYAEAKAAWWQENDPGTREYWENPTLDISGWKTMVLPQAWEDAGLPDFDGVVWFRNEIDIPEQWAGKPALLHLGVIDDSDCAFINGVQIGETDGWQTQRDYFIPAGMLKAGINIIAVRVLDTGGLGGIDGTPEQLSLEFTGPMDGAIPPIILSGDWLYLESVALDQMTPAPISLADADPSYPSVLYNGMIAPLVPAAIKGVIWYQGENNVGRGWQYRTLLPKLIADWRQQFGQPALPFCIVQLANLGQPPAEPSESEWAEIREAQLLTMQKLPNVGMAVTIDIGDANDIHPTNKQEVGRRLALAAEAIAYGRRSIAYSGPIYRSMAIEGKTIRISFTYTNGGLVARGNGRLIGFAIAGADKQFVWANARIDGTTVVVSSPLVPNPVAVRYAWADNPECNLYNGANLPASPFRTDQ